MDFDGILLLAERDRERFKDWLETSKNFSLEELRDSYNEWLKHYNDTYQKYKDMEDDDKTKNIALIGARLMYFHDLLNYALHALTAYTVKLKEEYDTLKNQNPKVISKKLAKSKRIEFSVDGKPPKKSTGPSVWSENSNQTELVVNLRQKAFEASQKKGFDTHFHGPVKLELTVYASNILERKDRHDYLGDLDAFVSGVFESLQPAPKNNPELKIHQALKNVENIGSDIPLIVADDAQITTTITKKRKNPKSSYTVAIEADISAQKL